MYKGPVRKRMRIEGYDYSLPGDYFITICTRKLVNYFGQIINSKVKLSNIGNIVDQCWKNIPNHFPYTELDKHIVMPNHIHGIVRITDSVGNWHANSLQENKNSLRRFQKLPLIIGSFKSAVTKYANRLYKNLSFMWQRYYYDHVIETDEALDNIREYITLNPENWDNDLENLKVKKQISNKEYRKLRRSHCNKLFRFKKLMK